MTAYIQSSFARCSFKSILQLLNLTSNVNLAENAIRLVSVFWIPQRMRGWSEATLQKALIAVF
jgi:hypothetical protein